MMTRQDIEARLEAGEQPVDLCIEHWEENRTMLEKGQGLMPDNILSGSCALCIVSKRGSGIMKCRVCDFAFVTGVYCPCEKSSHPWAKFHRAWLDEVSEAETKDRQLKYIDKLLDLLKKFKAKD